MQTANNALHSGNFRNLALKWAIWVQILRLGCGPTGLMGIMRLIGVGLAGLYGATGFGFCSLGKLLALNAASNASTTFSILRMSLAASSFMQLFSKGREPTTCKIGLA
jgi:hypothetical protein